MGDVMESVGMRRFTVEEYHRMGQAGVFAPGERLELIRGVIREKTPKGKRHIVAVAKVDRVFQLRLAGRAGVLVQNPLIRQDWHSEPEPDVLVASNPELEAYGTEHSSALLAIEVSDTSLQYDRTTKASLYAEAGVPEYWIINLVDDVLEVYRQPSGQSYQSKEILKPGSRITPQAWPDLEIDVSELIPSR
jgi:Uma2 family endonuclease